MSKGYLAFKVGDQDITMDLWDLLDWECGGIVIFLVELYKRELNKLRKIVRTLCCKTKQTPSLHSHSKK